MKCSHVVRHVVILSLVLAVGCSRDPNVRKQKYLESGKRYMEKGKYPEASIQFSNALQVDPKYADAHYQLALAQVKVGAWQNAYRELRRTVDLQPDNLQAQLDLGNLLVAGRDLDGAQKIAELVNTKDPKSIDAQVLLANVAAAQGKNDVAFEHVQQAIALDPNRSNTYFTLGILQARNNNLQAAEASFNRALALDQKSVPATTALGALYQQQKRWPEAEQQARRIIQLAPKDPGPRIALARLFLSEQQKDKAEQVLQQARKDFDANPQGYSLLGEFYVSTGDTEKALAEFASLHEKHPSDLKVTKAYIELLLDRNRIDEATKLNDEILKNNKMDPEAQVAKGLLLMKANKPGDAVPLFESVIKRQPDNAVAHYWLGQALNLTGDIGRAETEWREAARLRPGVKRFEEALVQVALRKGDFELLSDSAEELIKIDPSAPNGYVLRAMSEAKRKQSDKVEEDLAKAIQIAPQQAVGYIGLAAWRMNQKKFGEAEKLYEQALDRNPNAVDALRGLVAIYAQQKQLSKALDRVSAQIAKVPNNSAYYVDRGALQAANKDFAGAELSLQKAIELDKNNVDAFLMLGQVEVAQGATDKAIANSHNWIQANPKDVRGYVLGGSLEEVKGNWAQAQALYKKALDIQPQFAPAANNLAYSMLEHGGNIDVALSLAQQARQGMPESPNVADTLAWAYYQKGIYGLAIDLLEDGLKKAPNDATMHYHLGLAYQKRNDNAHARAHLERALKINPNYPQADEIRKALREPAA